MVEDKNEEKIYSFSYCTILFLMISSSFLGLTSFIVFQNLKHNAVISAVIGAILGIILLFSLLKIKKNMGEMDIIEYNIYVFGKIIGNVINVILNVAIFIIASIFLENMCIFINSNYLLDTSLIYIKILMLAPIAYAVSKKIATISRISQIIFIFNILFFIISIIGLFPKFDFERLMPVLSCSYPELGFSSVVYAICGNFTLFLLTIIPAKKVFIDKFQNRKIIFMYLFVNIFIILIMLIVVIVLGENLIKIYKYPEYLTLQEYSVFSIIERVENTLSLQFVLNVFVSLIMMVYFIYTSIKKLSKKIFTKIGKDILEKKEYESITSIIICILILIFTNVVYFSSVTFNQIIKDVYLYIVLIGIIIPMMFTMIIGSIKNKIKQKKTCN